MAADNVTSKNSWGSHHTLSHDWGFVFYERGYVGVGVLTYPSYLYCSCFVMLTTRSKTVEATAATNAEEVETSATSKSNEVRELREQLTLLTDLVEQ